MKVSVTCSLSSLTSPSSHHRHLLSTNSVPGTALDTLQILYPWLLEREYCVIVYVIKTVLKKVNKTVYSVYNY